MHRRTFACAAERESMSNILYVYERNIPTVAIMRNASEQNADPNGSVIQYKKITDITKENIDWCDVFSMIRPSDPYSVFLAKRAKESGCFVVAFFDDDLYNPPKSRPTPNWRIRNVRKAMEVSNVLSTCSPHIQNKYRDFTADKRAVCSNSVVNPSEIKLIPELTAAPADTKVKLLYAANPGHVAFFNHFILPVMPKLAQKYAGKLSMTFMGLKPELSAYKDQIDIEFLETMPLDEYRQKAQNGNYDIGLSPLISDEFTKCKYFNKFIEYTMAGIVGMYSNTEPYTYVVKDGENGFLVDDGPEDWYEALCRVIDDALLRNRCVRNAQEMLLTSFTADALAKRQEELSEFIQFDKSGTPCKSLWPQKMLCWFVPVLDKIYQVWFYLTRTGVSGLINRIKIRKKSAYSK